MAACDADLERLEARLAAFHGKHAEAEADLRELRDPHSMATTSMAKARMAC